MRSTTRAIVVLAICTFAVAAFAQNQIGTGNVGNGTSQLPTYNNGSTSPNPGYGAWGTLPTGPANTMDSTNYAFTAGQQFNSKWLMKNGNHDLTTNASNVNGAVTWTTTNVKQSRLCSFCHTAHDNTSQYPVRTWLWAHAVGTLFSPYSSPTLQSQPNTTSTSQTAMCLGCHDGTVAVTSGGYGLPAATEEMSVKGAAITSNGKINDPNLIVPLSRTHPVSFTYNGALAAKHQLRVPAGNNSVDGYGIVPLFGPGGDQMECATCHDPHIQSGIMRRQFPTGATQDNGTGSFCLYCHL